MSNLQSVDWSNIPAPSAFCIYRVKRIHRYLPLPAFSQAVSILLEENL